MNKTKHYFISGLALLAMMNGFSPSAAMGQGSPVFLMVDGELHSLALKSDGTVWAWGDNSYGQLGDGTSVHKSTPVQVSGLTGVTAIAAGTYYSLALKSDGTVWAWGYNFYGQLGDGTTVNKSTPVQVSNLTGVTAITAGEFYSLALKPDGTVWAWGNNSYGQLGDGTFFHKSTPVKVSGLTGVSAIGAGSSHSLALKSDGTVWAWGNNSYGQLGDGTFGHKSTPVQVLNLTGVNAIAAGSFHSLALKPDGTVWVWGRNIYGQLGDGTTVNKSTPVQVLNLTGVNAIAAGSFHSLALKSDGTVWAWGYNFYGQLGDGTTVNKSTPVQVFGLTGVSAIGAGSFHSLVAKPDGTVWAWGYNAIGQLGDGTRVDKLTPVQVIFTTSDTTPPSAPTNLTATAASETQINLSWTASTDNVGVAGYNVERCQGVGCTNFAEIAALGNVTTYNNTGLTAGTNYSYRVRARDTSSNFSGYSNTASATTPAPDTTPPTAPTKLVGAAASASQINLSWTASTDNVGVTGYRVERCQGAGCASFAQIASIGNVTSYSDSGLLASTNYSYRVRAADAAGNLSAYSNIASATTLAPSDTTPPSAPTNLTATAASETQINLSWTASTDNVGVAGYNVERCQGVGCANFAEIAALGNVTTYNNTGLTAGTNYSYRVRARDTSSNFSGYSNTASATTPAPDTTPPTAPTKLVGAAASASQINLSWTASTDNVGVTGYRVERCQGAGCASFAQIASIGNVTSYSDSGLLASTNYSYRVRAADAAGNLSAYSNIASATTLAPPGDADGDGLPDSQEGASAPHPYALDRVFLNTPGNVLTQDNVKGNGTGESGTWISSAASADTDNDGVGDRPEVDAGLNGGTPDSDGDGLCDGSVAFPGTCVAGEDANGNGIVDAGETNPAKADSMFRTGKSVSGGVIGSGLGIISFADGVNTQPTSATNVAVSDAALGGTTQARVYYLSGAMELRIKDELPSLKNYGLRIKGSGASGSATLLVGSVNLTKVQVSPGQEFVVTTSDLELRSFVGSPAVEQLLGGTTNVTIPVPAGNTATFPYDSTLDEIGVVADTANPATLVAAVQTGALSYTKKIPANTRVNFSPDNDATAIGANCKVAGSSVDFNCKGISGAAPGVGLVAVDTSGLLSQSLLVTSLGGGRTVGRIVRSGLPAVSEAFSDSGDELENTATTIGASPAHQIYAFRSNIGAAETVQARTGDGWASNSNFRLRPGVGVILSVASVRAEAMAANVDVVEADMLDSAGTLLFTAKLDPSEVVEMTGVQMTAKKGTITVVFPDGRQVNLAEGKTISGAAMDSDGDGVDDSEDACPQTAGNTAYQGCPVADKNIVTLHFVNIGAASTRSPLAGAMVRVFDRNDGNFQAVAGSKNPDGALYGVIYEADAGRVGACVTASDGVCYAGEARTGDYLVIVKYTDAETGKTVYVGRPKSPTDFTDTNGDGAVDLAEKDFQIMKVFKSGVFQEYRGGSKMTVTGSVLEIVMPESAVWEGTQSLYPFVFSSDGYWRVDACATVPTGYSIVGVYNETGTLVESTECVQTGVANEIKVIAFVVKETASPEPSFAADITAWHKGKATPVTVRVSDIRRPSFDAELTAARARARVSPAARKLMKVGASLWSIIRDMLGLEGRDAEIVATGKKVARLNAIRVPEWGITEGAYDAGALPWGFALDLGEEGLRLAR